MEEATAGKARLPTVESLTDGMMRRLVAAERRFRQPGTSTTRVSGPRYRGALPLPLYVEKFLLDAICNAKSRKLLQITISQQSRRKEKIKRENK